MNCPECLSSDLQCHGRRRAVYPLGLVLTIGLTFALLNRLSLPNDYRCRACGCDFAVRTAIGEIARVLFFAVLSALGFVFTALTLRWILDACS